MAIPSSTPFSGSSAPWASASPPLPLKSERLPDRRVVRLSNLRWVNHEPQPAAFRSLQLRLPKFPRSENPDLVHPAESNQRSARFQKWNLGCLPFRLES